MEKRDIALTATQTSHSLTRIERVRCRVGRKQVQDRYQDMMAADN